MCPLPPTTHAHHDHDFMLFYALLAPRNKGAWLRGIHVICIAMNPQTCVHNRLYMHVLPVRSVFALARSSFALARSSFASSPIYYVYTNAFVLGVSTLRLATEISKLANGSFSDSSEL